MKSVALAVLFSGYVLVVYGVNHVTGGCVSFKNTVWPTGATGIADPCAGGGGASPGSSGTVVGPPSVGAAGSGANTAGLDARTAGYVLANGRGSAR